MPRTPFLQPTFHVTSTRMNTLSGDPLPENRGKTRRSFDFVDRPRDRGVAARPRTTPDHLAVIRPPTASRLTARCRLRETRRFARVWRGGRGERRCLFGRRALRRIEPSDTSSRRPDSGAAGATLFPDAWARSHRGTSMRPAFQSPRCLPPEKTARASFESSRGALPRWPARAAAARVHRRSRTID
jgi:hypothetical protein